MPVRPRVRYFMRFLLALWSMVGARPSDPVHWTEVERPSSSIRKVIPEIKRRSGMTENTAPAAVGSAGPGARERAARRLRADAQRNSDAVLEAAKAVFGASGVDAPAKEIADLAGVGVGTLYRHFPRRSDLVKAVLQREIDACAAAAPALTAAHAPGTALAKWLHRYTEFLAT